ncbi:K(+)-transporting ATPase subunit F [Deinococcus psychrotolerans]|nr:K(+)-transporting ATPase subunit F [Deinococcus psychrotolerans]
MRLPEISDPAVSQVANPTGHQTDSQRGGASLAWAGMNVFLLVMVVLLCGYLLYSLIRPDKF